MLKKNEVERLLATGCPLGVLVYELSGQYHVYHQFSRFDFPSKEVANAFWEIYTHCLYQDKLQKDEIAAVIRAAFELGYIEQAMTCQRILDAIPDE